MAQTTDAWIAVGVAAFYEGVIQECINTPIPNELQTLLESAKEARHSAYLAAQSGDDVEAEWYRDSVRAYADRACGLIGREPQVHKEGVK